MNIGKRKIPFLSIGLYAIAGMLVFYTIWAVNNSRNYISELIAMGQLTFKGNEYDIVNFYMANGAQYAMFAVIVFSLGWMLQKITSGPKKENVAASGDASSSEEDEDDFEDWFQSEES